MFSIIFDYFLRLNIQQFVGCVCLVLHSVLLMLRDVMNPSVDDPFFPQFRHKDWFASNRLIACLYIISARSVYE